MLPSLIVLECVVASASNYIVTQNVRDFGRCQELGVTAITPDEFLSLLRRAP